jgi:hypothetical protein
MTKGVEGIWEVRLGPIDPGACRYNLNVAFKETAGTHPWINWRDYLHEFGPQLFP